LYILKTVVYLSKQISNDAEVKTKIMKTSTSYSEISRAKKYRSFSVDQEGAVYGDRLPTRGGVLHAHRQRKIERKEALKRGGNAFPFFFTGK